MTNDLLNRKTLCDRRCVYIPHADPFLQIPIFGLGWGLAVLVLVGVIVLGFRIRQHGWKAELLADLPMYLILGAAIYWVVPLVEEQTAAGLPLGIPIRAYGMMMLLGIVFCALVAGPSSQPNGAAARPDVFADVLDAAMRFPRRSAVLCD